MLCAGKPAPLKLKRANFTKEQRANLKAEGFDGCWTTWRKKNAVTKSEPSISRQTHCVLKCEKTRIERAADYSYFRSCGGVFRG
jgi:hypothetical protein